MVERSDKKGVGPLAAAPCPWCRHSNDFREIYEAGLLNKGTTFECDGCHRLMLVVAVRTMPQVVLAQTDERCPEFSGEGDDDAG